MEPVYENDPIVLMLQGHIEGIRHECFNAATSNGIVAGPRELWRFQEMFAEASRPAYEALSTYLVTRPVATYVADRAQLVTVPGEGQL